MWLTPVDQDVGASPLLDLELRREAFQATQTWASFALHEHAIAVMDEFVH